VSEWTEAAIPILRSVNAWTKDHPPGSVIDDEEIAKRCGLSARDAGYLRCLANLLKEGYLEGEEINSQTSYGVHVRGVTAQGLRELGQWPQVAAVTDVDAKRRIRGALVHKLYDVANGSTDTAFELHDLGDEIGITRPEAEDAGRYLEQEGLIQFVAEHGLAGMIAVTHRGVVEVEEGRQNPSKPTEHFVAAQYVMNINAPLTNSPIAQAAGDVHQQVSYTDIDFARLETIVHSVRDAIAGVQMDESERVMIQQNLDIVESNGKRSDAVGRRVVMQALRSTRSIMEGMVASGGYVALAHLVTTLPH
jgi:hypothetical protein